MNPYPAILFALGQMFDGKINGRKLTQRYLAELAAIEKMSDSPKGNAFVLAVRCTRLGTEREAWEIWQNLAELMLLIIRDDCHDQEVYDLHMILLRNSAYREAFRGDSVVSAEPSEVDVWAGLDEKKVQ
jgi:hypothetical protein